MIDVSEIVSLRKNIENCLDRDRVVILPPLDVNQSLSLMKLLGLKFDTLMLDPWYNKGVGGVDVNYRNKFLEVLRICGQLSEHVYFWGFPEIVAPFVERIPAPLELVCWLTWYYKNSPSVIRGWRSSQNACLHLSRPGARMFSERFLNEKQKVLASVGKLRYIPGPTSVIDVGPSDVIEEALLVGFIGRKEQTGHPSQKPVKVYDQLLQMTVPDNGIVFDPMCGSGTTGAVAKSRAFRAILSDHSEDFIVLSEKRLGVKRIELSANFLLSAHEAGV